MVIARNLCKQCVRKQYRFMSTKPKETPAEYCLNLVRNNDYENFLCTLLLPNEIKSTAFAIRAFNVEVALVEDRIKDKQIGMMRMNFWNKVIDNVYNKKPAKIPIALELTRVLQNHTLSKEYFKQLIDAREYKLTASKFVNIDSVEKYAENSVSPVYYLLLESNNITIDSNIKLFASHVGKAQGIVTLIRSVRYNASRETLMLPEDIILKNKLTVRAVLKGEDSKELRDTISEVADKAKEHVNKAMSLKHHLKGDSRIIFLPLYVTRKYLNKLSKFNYDIYHKSLVKRNNLLPLQLLCRKIINNPF